MPEIRAIAARSRGFFGAAGLVLLGAALVFPLLFGQSMGRPLSHDEHQHVAAGVLVAREGLLPYRDFPFFHTPLLPLVYGLFLGKCEYLLLATRLFSVVCASLIAGTLFLCAWRALAAVRGWKRLALAAVVPALFVGSPVVVFAAGRTSNHELSILFALLAALSHLAAFRKSEKRGWLVFLSGLLLALAMGTRVTFAPLVLPFLAGIVLRAPRGSRVPLVAVFAAGGVAGALPVLWLFFEAPAQFLYGVLEFSRTNLDYRAASGMPQNMTLLTKLRFLFKEIIVPNLVVVIAGMAPLAALLWQRRRAIPGDVAFALSLLPFVLIGALAPSPAFEQYFFALVPFVLLVGILCLPHLELTPMPAKISAAACVVAVVASAAIVRTDYRNLDELLTPAEWTPVKRHREAVELRRFSAEKILTLAPIHVLEAGLRIDPAFATGPFAWRVADFVPASKRRRLGLIGSSDLAAHLAAHPVNAILVGHEQQWEPALIAYAERHGYRRMGIGDEEEAIWLKPPEPPQGEKTRPAR